MAKARNSNSGVHIFFLLTGVGSCEQSGVFAGHIRVRTFLRPTAILTTPARKNVTTHATSVVLHMILQPTPVSVQNRVVLLFGCMCSAFFSGSETHKLAGVVT